MRRRTPHPRTLLAAATAAALTLALAAPGVAPATADTSDTSDTSDTADRAPGVPTAVDVDVRSGGDPAFAVRWSDPVDGTPTAYDVMVDGVVRGRVDDAVHAVVIESLDLGTTYDVGVRAVGSAGVSATVEETRVLTYGAATPVLAANPTNPLAGREWGVFLGHPEHSYDPWLEATGDTKAAIGEILLQPKAKWFGRWLSDDEIAGKVRDYLDGQTGGDPDVLAQLTMFRMDPWERDTCTSLPSAADQAGYRRYISAAAEAIGDTRVALVLQPDGPFAGCAPGRSKVYSRLIAWAARVFTALPRTSVYIDMGSPGWFRDDITEAVRLLVDAGVADVRGFALSVTHMDTTRQSVKFGSRIVKALAARGIAGTHFVVDTADNGRGFSGKQYRKKVPQEIPINWAPMCKTAVQRLCVALGIPPTTDVANPRWGLPASIAKQAATNVDGYLWINRPWLYQQTVPFMVDYAVDLAAQNPYD